MERSLRDETKLAAPETQELARPEESTRERYVEGTAPPATGSGSGAATSTASQLAYAEDDNERELKAKIKALVNSRYGGDYKKAFEAYDPDGDGAIDKAGLSRFLSDAGVGNGLTRGAWVKGIISKLDGSGDSKIQWTELQSMVSASA